MKTANIAEFLKIPEWKAKVIGILCKAHVSGPSEVDEILEVVNRLLGGFGTEIIDGKTVDHYYRTINVIYVNMGDTYTPTVLYDTLLNRFFICSWGDYVESKPKRFPAVA